MIKKQIKFVVSSFILGLIIGTLSTVVTAATAYSSYKSYGPINGYSYENRAGVSNDSNLSAETRVGNGSTQIPTGYMGAKARLYKSTTLCISSDWIYNSQLIYWNTTVILTNGCGDGIYSSKGITAAYNTGGGYTTFDTYQSPNINHP
jgi:hypothetical protein